MNAPGTAPAPADPGTQPPAPATPPPADPTGPGTQPPAPAPAGDFTPPTREEWEATQAELNRARSAAARNDRARRDQTRQQQQAAGQFEELYQQTQTELEAIRTGLSRNAVQQAAAEAASRLRFHNPTRAAALIDLAGIEAHVDLADGAARVELDQAARTLIEQRIARLAESDPYLLASAPPRQLPGAGAGQGNGDAGGHAAMNAEIRRAAGRG